MRIRNGQRFASAIAAQINRPQQVRSRCSGMGQPRRERQNGRATDEPVCTNRRLLQNLCGKRHQSRDTALGCKNAILKPALQLLACMG